MMMVLVDIFWAEIHRVTGSQPVKGNLNSLQNTSHPLTCSHRLSDNQCTQITGLSNLLLRTVVGKIFFCTAKKFVNSSIRQFVNSSIRQFVNSSIRQKANAINFVYWLAFCKYFDSS